VKMNDVQNRAKAVGVKSVGKSKEALIREIQRAEGNRDCFGRGESRTCGQAACAWRDDCN